ncbi:MAG: iron-containing alcohol dehydrogenase [Deltaproteobacteria bacterium]|nr:iron-containing alcohol dehydrogenase [Deltaproteobacteria bacterium]
MAFAFRTAGQVLFGRGESARAAAIAVGLGRRVLLCTGAASLEASGALDRLVEQLGRAPDGCARFAVPREPDVPLVDEATACARAEGCDVVLGCGGGAALDVAKAVAALATNGGGARDYLEDVGPGGGRALERPSLPTVLVPTTAGTGAEVTRNSVLRVPDRAVKRSMRSDLLLPRVAVIDPDLAAGAPPRVAAAAGLDALTHLVEAYVSRAAQPLTDALAVQGIPLALRGLRALADGAATPATAEGLALAALYGGMAVANAGLGAAHGLVAPLGGLLEVTHGVGCAALLPSVMLVNVAALRAAAPESPALRRYDEVAGIVLGATESRGGPGLPERAPKRAPASVERAARTIAGLRRRLGLPGMAEIGIPADRIGPLLQECRGGSMRANPVVLDDADLERILLGRVDE